MTSIDSDAQRLKKKMTLSLYLQRGAFWNAIDTIRKRWEIVACIAVPGENEFEDLLYGAIEREGLVETDYPKSPFDTRLPSRWWNDADAEYRWEHDIGLVFTRFVPPRLHHDLERSEAVANLADRAWVEFFQFCVLYDPPADRLLDFAKSGGPYALSEAAWIVGGFNPHVMYWRDPETVQSIATRWYERILEELDSRFLAPMGFDTQEAVASIINDPQMIGELEAMTESSPRFGVIPVFNHTNDQHLRQARAQIRNDMGFESKVGRSNRDELEAVQCAVWNDLFGFSHQEISTRMGWKTPKKRHAESRDPGSGKIRYGRVESHLSHGRSLLAQNNSAE